MISDRALEQAIADSVISPEQAERLRAIESALPSPVAEPADDESLRFVTGFADIFVTIGIVLFLGALAFLMDAGTGSTLMYAGLAASAWLLAEFFTFKRRMALPSIVLLVVFIAAIFVLSAQIAAQLLHTTARGASMRFWFLPSQDYVALALAAIVTTGMAAVHYIRFRVPITIAAGTAALCVLVVSVVLGALPAIDEIEINVVLFLCGLAVFALAMRFDMSDPERSTRRTDIAFWLHLLAAPLIVHPLIRTILDGTGQTVSPGVMYGNTQGLTVGPALGILWIFLILGMIAVVIDRRAILVSGLVYAGYAFGALIKSLGFSSSSYLLPTVILTLGAFILLLSAGWLPLRRAILRRLPTVLAARLPHPLVTSQA